METMFFKSLVDGVLISGGLPAWSLKFDHQTLSVTEINHVRHAALRRRCPFEGQPTLRSGILVDSLFDARLSHILITHHLVVFVPTKQSKQARLSEALRRCPEA